MNSETVAREFSRQIRADYEAFLKEWLKLEPHDMIEKSAEIAATRQCYLELREMELDDEQASQLLCLQNPLEAVRDQYLHQTDERRYAAIEGTTNTRLAVEKICEDQEAQTMSGYGQGVTMC